jgi:hypothetical protein
MKKIVFTILLGISLVACQQNKNPELKTEILPEPDTAGLTNNFYDNEPIQELTMVPLSLDGEIANPGSVDFSKLPVRSVIVKEASLKEDGTNQFIGAYRYDGYSLFDILNHAKLQKKNEEEFPPIIDLYVEISNVAGEKIVISWGEIYYSNNLHNIIIAKSVMRIVPSKTKDLWPLPETSKVIVTSDLLTERNISNPTKITIKSAEASFKIEKGMSPMYAESIKILDEKGQEYLLKEVPKNLKTITYNTVFYGRGRGIHSTTPFTGYELKEILSSYYKLSKENLQHGFFVVAGLDGYRVVLSYSELFNRNDQSEFLLIQDKNDKDGGAFRIFPAADFFSDRAVKSVSEIRFVK